MVQQHTEPRRPRPPTRCYDNTRHTGSTEVIYHICQIQELFHLDDYLTFGNAAASNTCRGISSKARSASWKLALAMPLTLHSSAGSTPSASHQVQWTSFHPFYGSKTTLQAATSAMCANFEASTRHTSKEGSKASRLIVPSARKPWSLWQ